MTAGYDPDMRLSAAEKDVVARAEQFAVETLAIGAPDWEKRKHYPVEAFQAAAELGLAGILTPVDHGGAGMSMTGAARIIETLASQCMAFTFAMVVHNNLAKAIAASGTTAQQQKYLPDMLAARKMGAFLLTEPGAGTDAANIECQANPVDGGWRLSGEKAWVSNAVGAEVLSVYAQTDPSQGWKGIACFLVDASRPGVERLPAYDLVGGHALGTGGFRFNDVELTPDDVMIPVGEAFKGAMGGINTARVFVGAMCSGMMRASLDRAVEYTKSRAAFGQNVADFQGIQWMLADVQTDLEAARLLTYRGAAEIDDGETGMLAAAHAKKFATRAAMQRISDCAQVMGAQGARTEEVTARHFTCTKLMQYMDGVTEVQNLVLSRALFDKR